MAAQDEQGWYHTGDLGHLTENGHIVVCGRVKDVIIMAGRNIYPIDIERAACSRIERQVAHEVVAEVAVRARQSGGGGSGFVPKTLSGEPRRSHALSLVG